MAIKFDFFPPRSISSNKVTAGVALLLLLFFQLQLANLAHGFMSLEEKNEIKGDTCTDRCWGEQSKSCDGVQYCEEDREEKCGTCFGYMHWNNPISISLIALLVLLICGGLAAAYWYWKKRQRVNVTKVFGILFRDRGAGGRGGYILPEIDGTAAATAEDPDYYDDPDRPLDEVIKK